ncbi:MAG: SDR family oxidoreductase [Chitinophagales bacterium]
MSDYLLEKKWLRSLVKSLKLPLPLPPYLNRASKPYTDTPLEAKKVILSEFGFKNEVFLQALEKLGANTYKSADEEGRPNILIFNSLSFTGYQDLDEAYFFFKPLLKKLSTNGRILILAEGKAETVAQQTMSRAMLGLIKTLAKESGKKGISANVLFINDVRQVSDEVLLNGITQHFAFWLSEHSAYVSGQSVRLNLQKTESDLTVEKALEGKNALVTGGSKGIGAAIAEKLAGEGALVYILDIPPQEIEAKRVMRKIKGKLILADVTDPELPNILHEKFGEKGLDILVHNAGITKDKTLANMPEDWWKRVLDINFRAIVNINKELMEQGTFNANARITHLSSISGLSGNYGQSNYVVCKAALIEYCAAMARNKKHLDMVFNAIAPGFIETDMTAKMPFFTREGARRLSAFQQGGTPDDVAELALYLSLPAARAINGQCVRVCGGNFMGA